jgi:hypothetical protein
MLLADKSCVFDSFMDNVVYILISHAPVSDQVEKKQERACAEAYGTGADDSDIVRVGRQSVERDVYVSEV